jgi:hypothetical protein
MAEIDEEIRRINERLQDKNISFREKDQLIERSLSLNRIKSRQVV